MPMPRTLPLLVATALLGGIALDRTAAAQGNTLQFAVSATDAVGKPVTDLKPEDIVMTEDGVR